MYSNAIQHYNIFIYYYYILLLFFIFFIYYIYILYIILIIIRQEETQRVSSYNANITNIRQFLTKPCKESIICTQSKTITLSRRNLLSNVKHPAPAPKPEAKGARPAPVEKRVAERRAPPKKA